MTTLYVTVAVVSYLLGSIPFGYVLVRIFRGEDIRQTGSGNIGATNVARSGAKGLGIATLALDAIKGALAVWLAAFIAGSKYNSCGDGLSEGFCVHPLRLMATAALVAVLGHIFPVWLRFKGGKGVATALGVFCVLFPKAILVALAIFILVVAVTRYVSLGSILGAVAFPVAAYFMQDADWLSLLLASGVSLIIIVKHHQNIGRLLGGTEHRFGASKTAVAEKQL
ncbi:MAG TPA: glycerol-3-phosphate 1-O-acyltransferase PlsY [Candidatus Dormibacteraeota bacterium]|jgi:glycerol-3-phosphate acyltransferase PlsY|nr:glycerol-3-phosphate 1-O-acyltransferase PlsY [Candidatus Dormibacteraeota bacterium]